MLTGCDGVVPFTVKALGGEVDLSHLFDVASSDLQLIGVWIIKAPSGLCPVAMSGAGFKARGDF